MSSDSDAVVGPLPGSRPVFVSLDLTFRSDDRKAEPVGKRMWSWRQGELPTEGKQLLLGLLTLRQDDECAPNPYVDD
ncbi:hypothetical protein OUZ56_022224 [Daphnia magna]|uniref:Uncharacterized protein n=1 Tax=Daphnia magna TaxID=35525 RepID=A0ABR0AVR3_9CRUS|nr:hypothetical protein OUZ56_022224 [Daphnia magna]